MYGQVKLLKRKPPQCISAERTLHIEPTGRSDTRRPAKCPDHATGLASCRGCFRCCGADRRALGSIVESPAARAGITTILCCTLRAVYINRNSGDQIRPLYDEDISVI